MKKLEGGGYVLWKKKKGEGKGGVMTFLLGRGIQPERPPSPWRIQAIPLSGKESEKVRIHKRNARRGTSATAGNSVENLLRKKLGRQLLEKRKDGEKFGFSNKSRRRRNKSGKGVVSPKRMEKKKSHKIGRSRKGRTEWGTLVKKEKKKRQGVGDVFESGKGGGGGGGLFNKAAKRMGGWEGGSHVKKRRGAGDDALS